jgi:RNA polymerase sigma-70 factor (ECF subfamily)
MTQHSAPSELPEHDPEQQFRALYDGNFAAVLGYALRRVDQPADAADVVSEVFLVAWRRLGDAPPGDGRPWLFGIAKRLLANYHRGQRRRQRLGGRLRDVLARDVVPDPATGVAEWDRVRRLLLRLRPDDRELLMLVGWDGLTPTEAAEVVGIAPGAARMRLARARQRFRELVDPGCDAPVAPGHVQAVPFEHVIGESR